MELQTTIYLVVGATFALYIGIALWARAGSTSEFYAAGGQVPPVMNGMATALTGCRPPRSFRWPA
jgi:cation/acetate symporter